MMQLGSSNTTLSQVVYTQRGVLVLDQGRVRSNLDFDLRVAQ
jgi:hypothetical protein